MPIEIITPTQSKNILSLWDSASTVSLILISVANTLKIPGKAVSIVMETLGQTKRKQTKLFKVNIGDRDDNLVLVEAYGVDLISTEEYSTEPHRTIFPTEFQNHQDKREFISILLGLNVVQYHPVPVKCCGNFVLFENALKMLTLKEIEEAWNFIVKHEQKELQQSFESGKFERLGAFKNEKGLIMAGRRINEVVPLLPKSSKFVKLAKKEAHQPGHLGELATATKFVRNFGHRTC